MANPSFPVPGRRIVLPWSKALEIAVESLRVRFGRSLITSGSIALATAFFMDTLANQAVLGSLKSLGNAEINFMLQRHGIDLEDATPGIAPRDLWIIATSMVVCLVGVSNALLMSVTERIKEIGTMKCLGALNWFVVELFLLESLALGALGSLAGAVVGTALAIVPWLLRAKELAAVGLPWRVMGLNLLIGVGVGMLLTVFGALYPALRAAQMAPAEAMRTEV